MAAKPGRNSVAVCPAATSAASAWRWHRPHPTRCMRSSKRATKRVAFSAVPTSASRGRNATRSMPRPNTIRTSSSIPSTRIASTRWGFSFRFPTMAARRSATSAKATSTSITTKFGSTRTSRIITSSAAMAAFTRASTAARTGTSNRTYPSRSSTISASIRIRRAGRFTTSTAARRITLRSAARCERAAATALRTPIGTSCRAATAFIAKSTRPTRTPSTANINTAGCADSTAKRATASTFNRRPPRANRHSAGTGMPRSPSARTTRNGCTSPRINSSAATTAATRGSPSAAISRGNSIATNYR